MANKEYNIQPSTFETIDTAIYNLVNDGFDLTYKYKRWI